MIMKMNFNFYTLSDKGEFRSSNQDCAYAKTFSDDKGTAFFGVVCDGMGGLAHGEVASSTVVKSFAEWFEKDYPLVPHNETFEDTVALQWQKIVSDCNDVLRNMSAQNAESMGTTLSALLLADGRFYAAQIGDSRVYIGNGSENLFVALTKDHSMVAEMAENGLMTAEEARLSKEKNVLTRCIGVMREVRADYYSGNLNRGDYFVICSDGFCSGTLPAQVLASMGTTVSAPQFSQTSLEVAVNSRRAGGERDNITAVFAAVDWE